MRDAFHLFAYGTLKDPDPATRILDGCERVGRGVVRGTVFDIGPYPALMLGGDDPVPGVIWHCPVDRLPDLDAYEGVDDGLFRRAAVTVDGYACWVYVAGPKLGPRLVPAARLDPASL